MKTSFNEIVNVNAIGKMENPISMNELLAKAGQEKLQPSHQDKERVLFLAIDMQNDFMEGGALPVSGSLGDVERATKFIYDNMEKITTIAMSIDTHTPHQIFHPCFWVDQDGNHPVPYTVITSKDLDDGKWMPVINPTTAIDYVKNLEKQGKKQLMVWAYHCLQGTQGCAIENQFSNMAYFHSVAKKSVVERIVKGQKPFTEFYGILKPEYDPQGYVNIDFLNKVEKYDKIVVAGEAKDYCVYESLKQILEFYSNKPEVLKRIYVLEDCTSGIQDAQTVDKMYVDLQKQYKFNVVNSTSFSL